VWGVVVCGCLGGGTTGGKVAMVISDGQGGGVVAWVQGAGSAKEGYSGSLTHSGHEARELVNGIKSPQETGHTERECEDALVLGWDREIVVGPGTV